MRPKRLVDIDDARLSAVETKKVRRGEADLQAGRSKKWLAVKRELAD
jgi:hypothetical protein